MQAFINIRRLFPPRTGVTLLIAAFLLSACRGGLFTEKDPLLCKDCNLLVISMSNLQKRKVGLYGDKKGLTPNIDEFFKDSLIFDEAYAAASLTFTDAASLFYSLTPFVHKLHHRRPRNHEESAAILRHYMAFPRLLNTAGYKTAGFVSDEDYAYYYLVAPNFDYYFDRTKYPQANIEFRAGRYNIGTKDLVDPTLQWLKQNSDKKFFLFFQAYDVHCPYTPGPEYRKRFDSGYTGSLNDDDCYMTIKPAREVHKDGKKYLEMGSWFSMLKKEDKKFLLSEEDVQHLRNLNDGELAEADARLARIFDFLESSGLARKTVVVFMTEHGDYLGENGYFMKNALDADGNLHEGNIGFPLMIRLPGLSASKRVPQLTQTVDVTPTFLDILGYPELSAHMQGRSMLTAVRSGKELYEYAYSGSVRDRLESGEGRFLLEALQNREWKLTRQETLIPPKHGKDEGLKYKLVRKSGYGLYEKDVSSVYPEIFEKMKALLPSYRQKAETAPPVSN